MSRHYQVQMGRLFNFTQTFKEVTMTIFYIIFQNITSKKILSNSCYEAKISLMAEIRKL
jgi:hypothetical protein